MTFVRPSPTLRRILLAVGLGTVTAAPARAEDPPPLPAPKPAAPPEAGPPAAEPAPLPPGVVARVRGTDVTVAEFHRHLAQRLRPDLGDPKSEASTTLGMRIEETVVEQEAKRLGVVVTSADVDARYAELDAAVRKASNAKQTLADLLKHQSTPVDEFRHNLRMLVLKERVAAHATYLGPDLLTKDENSRLAQVEVVMGQLLSKARVEREGLPAGVVVRVNGEPLTDEAFGAAVDLRMRTARYLGQYVESLLLRDLSIDDAALTASIDADRRQWERVRVREAQPELQTLPFEEFVRATHGRSVEELRSDPHFRALHALKAHVAGGIRDDDVKAEWVRSAATRYGPALQVLDVQVSFKIPSAIVESVERRTRDEAQRIVTDLARRIAAGETKAVVQEIQDRKGPDGRPDRSIQAVRRTVQDAGNAQIVFQEASKVADGEWTRPFETISEWHLARRERFLPAPSFEDAQEQVRHDLVVARANAWLQERLRDRSLVQVADRK